MSCNIKKPNNQIRIFIGFVIVVLGFYFESLLWIVGLIPITFALIGFCPLCAIKSYANKSI